MSPGSPMSHFYNIPRARGLKKFSLRISSLKQSMLEDDVIPVLRNKIKSFLKLTFVDGPRQLTSSRITGKCAGLMAMLCAPALLFCALLTIPAMVFQSPKQHAYFEFSRVLNQDPTRWAILLLAGACTIFSLALPASLPGRKSDIRY